MAYFNNVYNTIMGLETLDVKPVEAKIIIEVIEKAYQSNNERRVVDFDII